MSQLKAGQRRVIALLITATALVAITVIYALWAGMLSDRLFIPLARQHGEIGTNAALAHLWMEEVIAGDRETDPATVRLYFDLANQSVDRIMRLDEDLDATPVPAHDHGLHPLLAQIKKDLAGVRTMAEQRMQNRRSSGSGTTIDQQFDKVFDDLMANAADVDARIQSIVTRAQQHTFLIHVVLAIFCVSASIICSFALIGIYRRRLADLANLSRANQQLQATEQQLRATNQQLMAGEQQLRAANQQLQATEQQLRASNQQLSASEHRFRSLFSDMAEGLAMHRIVYDSAGRAVNYEITEVNPQYEAILGVRRDQIVGKLATEAYGIDEPPYLDLFTRVAASGTPEQFETYFPPMDRHFAISVSSFGRGLFATIFTDITGRKRNEEQVRLHSARNEVLIELHNYQARDDQDLLDHALEKSLALTGSTIGYIYHYSEERKEFTLNSWSRDVMDSCMIQEKQTVYQLDKTGIWGEAVRQRRPIMLNDFHAPHAQKKGYPAGHAPLHRFLTVPIMNGSIIVGVVGVANKPSAYDDNDQQQLTLLMNGVWRVLEKRHAEEETLKLQQQLEKIESVGTLAGGIAHDFNNLLTAIMGNVSLAKMQVQPGHSAVARLDEAEAAIERAKSLTHQLLTFAKGGAPIRKAVGIEALVREAGAFALRGSSVGLRIDSAGDLWNVDADAGQISQVFHNLLMNATEAMAGSGSIAVRLANLTVDAGHPVAALAAGNYVQIDVEDQGPGIPHEHLDRIFQPYFSTKQRGSGLGLAISHSIVRKHDGSITVESKQGIGTHFTIILPAARGVATARENEDSVAAVPKGSGKVLIMDDEATVRAVAREILMHLGYEVEVAECGRTAIKLYEEAFRSGRRYDAVIMDLTIPGGMGGKEAIVHLRALDPEVKAIVSSGYSNDPVMADFRNHGFSGIVAKPFDVSQLCTAIRSTIEGPAA